MAYIRSQGCSIWYKSSTTSPTDAYARIGQVTSVTGPDGSTTEVDVSHLASTGKESIAGLPDFGSVSTELIWDPATPSTLHELLWNDFLAGTVEEYQIRLSDSPATTLSFEGYPNQYSINLSVDEAVRASFGIKISGSPTLNTP